ncbi:hypothetical protein ASD54_21815 [Rhizobium sp. Root149]|uniref:SDR family NAD(P)-dependent oxidoreductase n=1 Tax=Rhizobium sp. Root149 TaxID=1736473 RepID=UPI0007158714|nr:SDR family NAD(P)-dependent oxidoreductase [Rhizobium sp. Root149]KQZ46652.1 hypothetical protein ASD54_21815 [Rhizobium sp. Root149]
MTIVDKRLSGRTIVIAGGGSGIGRATADLFVREGARVGILDRSLDAGREVAEACGGDAVEADITEHKSVEQAFLKLSQSLGSIDGLVVTAGIFDAALFRDTGPEIWNRSLAVNLTGTYTVCRCALPYLEKSANSTIVTLGSGVALVPPGPGSAAYVASKGGVIAFSRALAIELAPSVRVNCVCPGMVDTPMTGSAIKDADGEVKSSVASKYAMNRVASAQEIAASILFLTSNESSYVTGATLAVDGGRTFH